MTLAEYIQTNRGAAADLARALGVSHSTVSRWAAGHTEPSLGMLRAIERATDGAVTVAELVAEAG